MCRCETSEVDCIMLVPPGATVVPLNFRRGAPKMPHAGFAVRLPHQAGLDDQKTGPKGIERHGLGMFWHAFGPETTVNKGRNMMEHVSES